jgi:hypothetical protein
MGTPTHNLQSTSDKAIHLSGWPDLNRRPLDPQIGPLRVSSVNHLSLVSMADR